MPAASLALDSAPPLILAIFVSGLGWMTAGRAKIGVILLLLRVIVLVPLLMLTMLLMVADCLEPDCKQTTGATVLLSLDLFVLFGVPILSAIALAYTIRRRTSHGLSANATTST